MINMKSCLYVLLLLLLGCTNNKNNKDKSHDLGKYVYVDREKCLHIDRNCIKFIISLENDQGIIFIDTAKLEHACFIDFCSQCVDDKCYEQIEKILNDNK